MRRHFVLAGMLAILPWVCQGGDLYRWVDKSGKVHYGDTRAPDATEVEKKKFDSHTTTGDEGLSFETRLAKQHFPVTLYVSGNCGNPCSQGRNLLNERGIPFVEKSLSTPEEISAFKRAAGTESVPALAVGKNWVKGFQASQWHSELDVAGYPKTTTYRPQAQVKSPADKPPVAK
jgi:hypothetical protein